MHDWYPFLRNISTSNFDLLSCAQCSQYLWFPRYTREPRSQTLLLLPLTLVIRTFTDKKWFINPKPLNNFLYHLQCRESVADMTGYAIQTLKIEQNLVQQMFPSLGLKMEPTGINCLNNTWCKRHLCV
eukprot:205974_1